MRLYGIKHILTETHTLTGKEYLTTTIINSLISLITGIIIGKMLL